MEELTPTKAPGKEATLVQTGSDYLVEVKANLVNDEFVLSFFRHGEQFDKEIYELSGGAFMLKYAAGETFSPPIPLLKFPMKVGEEWPVWKGASIASGWPEKAEAQVTTEQKSVVSCGLPLEAVVTEVRLKLAGPPAIERKMYFYFAKDQGLFKREFGTTSMREPVCP